jgi:hypothetical protein
MHGLGDSPGDRAFAGDTYNESAFSGKKTHVGLLCDWKRMLL